jgi:hypothetical protein
MNALRERLLSELNDYFLERGRFEAAGEFVGMSASEKPELMTDYFRQITPEERAELSNLLTEVAVGRELNLVSAFPGAVPSAVQVLYSLSVHDLLSQSSESVARLEAEFSDPGNIGRWIRAGDMTASQGGAAFKETWHYAAALCFILTILGSEEAAQTRAYLLNHASSEDFREALKNQRPLSELLKQQKGLKR